MSQEQKQVEKSLADQRVDKILERISELQKEMEQYKPPVIPSSKHEHWKAKELLESTCPDCVPEVGVIKKVGADEHERDHGTEIAQKVYKERATLPHKCTRCGLGVKEEELREPDKGCILCGNKQAR